MGTIGLSAFAFAVGLTLCGLAGSALELVSGRRLAFAAPYVCADHVVRSLAVAAIAGPFMLINDAMAAHRARRITLVALVSCGLTALLWTLALGLVAVSSLLWAIGIA